MKLRRLALLRYGHLSDVALEFPPGAALHVVHGANEAGKSTALAAIADALFGFGHRTAFDFLHGGPQLRVGFTLTARDGTEAAFTRRKGRGGTLRDESDQVVPEDALHRFLGGASRELFEHTFGLDGERLRAGGAMLAQEGGAVGESLFAAGTGLLGLRRALARLEEEAKLLVGDGRGRRRLSEAVDTWRQAQRASDEHAVPPRAWMDTETAHAEAVAALAQVQEDASRLRVEGSRLQRVRRVAPLLAELDGVRAALITLADAPHLPADVEATLQRACAARQEAARDAARDSTEAARLIQERAALAQDAAVLGAQDAIDLLVERRAIVAQATEDLPNVRLDVAGHRASVAEAVAELRIATTPEAARDTIPPVTARRTVQQLVSQHAALVAKADAAARALAVAGTRQDQARAALQARPAPPSPMLLRATVDAARSEGPVEAELARADHLLAEAQHAVETSLAALPLWQGDKKALAACKVPMAAAAETVAARLVAADQATAAATADVTALAGEVLALEDEVSRLARGETVPTPEAVLSARALRDRAWRLLRRTQEGGAPPDISELATLPQGPLPDTFERLRDAADYLADQRADQAQRVADYLSATARLGLLRGRRATIEASLMEAERALAEAESAWRAVWAPTGLVPEVPVAMVEWCRARTEVLKLAANEAEARRQRDDLAARRDRARAALLALMPDAGTGETLAATLLRAETACAAAEATATKHRTLAEALAREEAGLPQLQEGAQAAREALSQWQVAWAQAVSPLGLPASCEVNTAEAALSTWARIAEAAPAWRTGEQRIAKMTTSIAVFDEAVRAVQAGLAEAQSDDLVFLVATRLVRRLADARKAAAAAAALTERIGGHERTAAEAADRGRAAEAELAVLRLLAGAADDAGLEPAIERARRRDAVTADIARLARELIVQGDGQDEDTLRAEAGGVDPDAAIARLDDIEAETALLGERRETLSAARTRAEATLSAMCTGHDAAGAAQDAQHALADARAAAERYARLHVARVLLRSGIDRFRRAQQGPLLLSASAHFAALTGRRYIRLGVDEDANGRLLLIAVRDEGTECPIEALSEGTRDQLYLALRIAAIEVYAGNAEPLPFIADDLLVHFDDARATAAISMLAQLGRTAQVILFTHHEHIAGLAAAQEAAGVVVLRLADMAPTRAYRALAEALP